MAIVRVTPTQVEVSCGLFDGRPRSIRVAHEKVPVIEIAQIRDEIAAYPVGRGPRRIFDVRTPDASPPAGIRASRSALVAGGAGGRLTFAAASSSVRGRVRQSDTVESPPERLRRPDLAEFSERLASSEPVPGGGSASAIAGSLAASLLAMVGRLSLDRPKYEAYRMTNERSWPPANAAGSCCSSSPTKIRSPTPRSRRRDEMPRETADEQQARDEATAAAARVASDVPLAIVRECAELLDDDRGDGRAQQSQCVERPRGRGTAERRGSSGSGSQRADQPADGR